MAKVKVTIPGTIGKSITFDPDATVGATIGTNLFFSDGSVPTLSELFTAIVEAGVLAPAVLSQAPSEVKVFGTPVDNQLAIWINSNTIEGNPRVTYNLFEFHAEREIWCDSPGGGNPRIYLDHAGGPVDEKLTRLTMESGFFVGTFMNDANTAGKQFLRVNRSGTTSTEFGIMSGAPLAIYDSSNTDHADFSHDGVDFNTTFAGTTDWNISGIANIIMSGVDLQCQDNLIIRPELDDYSITSATATVSANAVTLTYSTAQSYELDLEAATGNVTITISGGPPTGTYGEMIIKIQQDTTAARTVTWAGGTFIFPGDVEVEPSPTADSITIFYLSTWDGGTTWYINGVAYG